MREDVKKTKLVKLNIVNVILIVLIVCVLGLQVWDFVNPITSKELSREAASKLTKAASEVHGAKGKVIAKYVDTNGNYLADAETYEGTVGDEYALERKKISGYKAYGQEPYSKTGNYTVDDIEVTFVYQTETESVDYEQEDNNVTVMVKTEKSPAEYNLKIVSKDEKGNLIKGLKYDVTKGQDKVRSGMVEGDTFVAGTLTVNKIGEDTFKLSEDYSVYFEPLFGDDFEFKLVKTWNSVTGKYEAKVEYNKNIEGLEIKVEGNEIIIYLTHKPREVIVDYGGETKEFDLEITKYISNIVVDNGKTTKEINRTIEDKDSILKLEIPPKELTRTIITATYTIRVENVGNVAGCANEIIDYIPDNFELVEDDNWTLVSDKAITNSLAETILNPGEQKEIEITFIWNIGNDNIGYRTNIVKATGVTNDEEIDDKTPINTDEAMAIVTVSTGIKQYSKLGILIFLIILAVLVYREKRKIENEK